MDVTKAETTDPRRYMVLSEPNRPRLFARTDVLGFEQMIYELTPDAIELGLAAALPAVFELTCTIGEFGRGERSQNIDFVLMA